MKAGEWDKIAGDYFNNLTSPFEKGVSNPLQGIVKRIKGKRIMDAADFGTGIGNFVPFLEDNFKSVTAVDFSEKMIEAAKKRSKGKASFVRKDIRNLKGLYGKFDVVFAINSILMPSMDDIKKSISEIRKTMKKGGRLFAVFPSMESVLYKAMVAFEYESGKLKSLEKAMKKTRKKIEDYKYDFIFGFVDEEGKQKHFYMFEIEHILSNAGFRKIEFGRVEYPWKIMAEKYFLKFSKRKKMWDWLVTAEK